MSADIKWRSDFDVEMIDSLGSDQRICAAARVSTQGAASLDGAESRGLLNFLMKNRHGTPFEHVVMQWRISAPIAVWREFHRHRIASYNEESARYKVLDPVFYIPPPHRPLVQIGKPGAYEYVPGTDEQYKRLVERSKKAATLAYDTYLDSLDDGIAREVARFDLPVRIYSTCYVTMNARSLMNFLSLRTKDERAMFPSFPQWEIEQVADSMENHFFSVAPMTCDTFHDNGRVQP